MLCTWGIFALQFRCFLKAASGKSLPESSETQAHGFDVPEAAKAQAMIRSFETFGSRHSIPQAKRSEGPNLKLELDATAPS